MNSLELETNRPIWLDYLMIIVGTFLMGFAIKTIYDPISLVTGGFTGIAIIVKNATKNLFGGDGIPLWVTNYALNIPLFVVAYKIKGKHFIGRTFFATTSLSLALMIIPEISILREDYVLACIFGGVITGAGTGLVFLARATTGGTDMLAAVIQNYCKHYSIAQVMQIIDGLVVVIGAFVFGINKALYAVICVYVVTLVSDGIIEGLKFSKAAFIISEQYDKIASEIMLELDRGVTGINATGMYSNNDKKMLFCVVSKKEMIQVKEITAKIDPNAFVIVSDVREVFGEGFIEYKQKK